MNMALVFGNILTSLSALALDTGPRDDDTTDRLNNVVMYRLLILLALATGSVQYVGSPINCWIPAEYKEKFHDRYANNHCWINSLYNIPFLDSIPDVEDKRYLHSVSFYRWATVIFIVLAFLFRFPQILWKELKHYSGVNVEKLVAMTLDTAFLDQDKRDAQLSHVAEFFHRWVASRTRPHLHGDFEFLRRIAERTIFGCSKRTGYHLVLNYLLIKFLYLANTVGQFFIISSFLKTNFWRFGLDVLNTYIEEGAWEDEDTFPRVALCDMKIRQLQNVNTYTFQCVLTVNLFLEKMFLVVWFCLLFMLIANAISCVKWSFQLLCQSQTKQFLMSFSGHFLSESITTQEDKRQFLDIVSRYLKPDGLFVVRLISVNTTDMLTVDLIRQIWLKYKKSLSARAQSNGGGTVAKTDRIDHGEWRHISKSKGACF